MAGARPAWSGAFQFAGFPIHVSAFALTKSRSSDSFKTLDRQGRPVRQLLVDGDGDVIDRADTQKGYPIGKDTYKVLPVEAIEAIGNAESTKALDVERFCALDGVPIHLSRAAYRLVPDPKIPGAEGPVGILWNGLLASNRALVTTWVPRAGSRDDILVVHADVHGLNANALPFADELKDVPEFAPEQNDQAAAMFEQFVELNYSTDEWAHSAYASSYQARRDEAIRQALAGETITVAEQAAAPAPAPDLMAAMAAALESSKPTTKPKAKAKAKTPAKA